MKHEGGGRFLDYSTVFGAIGVAIGIGGLYISYKGSIMEWKQKKSVKEDRVVEPEGKSVELEGFD